MKNKEKNGTAIRTLIVLTLAVLLSLNLASAYQLVCLTYGESLPPESADPRYTCNHDQCLNICVTDTFFPTNPSKCNLLGACEWLTDGEINLDITPPILTINSPNHNQIFDSRAVRFDLRFNEPSSIYWMDTIDGRNLWKRICSNCDSNYNKTLSFSDGSQSIVIKAVDRYGNAVNRTLNFTVDSQDPKLKKNLPKADEFASGDFFVEFMEINPVNLTLFYGNSSSMKGKQINLGSECIGNEGEYKCNTHVNLNEFNGQEIEYWFFLKDIAGNNGTTRPWTIKVDSMPPVINLVNYTIDGKYVNFVINVTEEFISEVGYIDLFDSKPKEKKMCSKLENGLCERKITFQDGLHNVTIYATDEVGHRVSRQVIFFTDSNDPKIKKTYPKRNEFISGDFIVEFTEINPNNLTLFYGNASDMRSKRLNLGTECTRDDEDYTCETFVNLNSFNNKEISYWFELTDLVGNMDKSKPILNHVDTIFPTLRNSGSFWNQSDNYISFHFNVTEINFDEISYYDHADGGLAKWKSLCTQLDSNGICDKKKSFKRGLNHTLDIQIMDEAGNSISAPQVRFFVSD